MKKNLIGYFIIFNEIYSIFYMGLYVIFILIKVLIYFIDFCSFVYVFMYLIYILFWLNFKEKMIYMNVVFVIVKSVNYLNYRIWYVWKWYLLEFVFDK